jgi:heat shock protein HtpX
MSLLVIALALAPALLSWWTGRGILARADDPALPEILLDRRRRLGGITVAGVVVLAVVDGASLYWTLPLLWVALLVGNYPLRRGLFAERWSLPAFLRYAISAAIGQSGWRLLVVIGPLVTVTCAVGIDPDGGAVARRVVLWLGGAFSIVMLLWQRFYARVWLDLHHATPLRQLARAELVARLDDVLDRAKLRKRPGVYRFGAPGGHFVNAFAIPSLYAPAVVLSDGLLGALTDDEIVGVFAHEVAHHEQFTRRRLGVAAAAGALVALFAFSLPIAFLMVEPAMATLSAALLGVIIVASLGRRSVKRRHDETASDLRAAALTGDPEALASALTKVHLYNRVPRRWPHAIESAATHPSLARRIQALRGMALAATSGNVATGIVATPALPLAVVRSKRGDTVVVLETTRAHWFDGVPEDTPLDLEALRSVASSYRAIGYSELVELRVGTAGDERTLNAVDLRGTVWSVPIAPSDVRALQTALDAVDVKLGPRPVPIQPAGMATARLLAIAALLTLVMTGEAGVVLVPILFVLFRPALTAAVAAAGAISLGRAIVALTSFAWIDAARQTSVIGAVAAGVALLVVAVLRTRGDARRDASRRPPREAWLLVLLLGGAALMFVAGSWPLALARPASLVSSPLAISAATTLAGLGAAIATTPGLWRRASGSLLSIIALATTVVLAGDGSFYNRSAALAWNAGTLTPAGIAAIPGTGVSTLEASPGGDSYAVTQFRPLRRGAPGNRYLIGRFGAGAPRASDALQVVFLDDREVLALALRGSDGLELRAESVSADSLGLARLRWVANIPTVEMPRLLVDRGRRLWAVLGQGEDDRKMVVATGSFDGGEPRILDEIVSGPADVGEPVGQPLAAFMDGTTISVTLPGLRDPESSFGPMLMLMAANPRWELRSEGRAGEHVLADFDGVPTCGIEVDGESLVCVEHLSNRTRLWRVGPASAVAIGDLPAAFSAAHPLGGGRVAAVERFGSRMAVVDLTARRGVRLTLPIDDPRRTDSIRWTADVVAAGNYVLVLSSGRAGATVRRYRLGP